MRLFKQSSSFYLILFVAMLFNGACTPTFDWRTQRYNTHGDQYSITLPGKALAAQKTVLLNTEPTLLSLNGVQVDGAQFVLGHVPARDTAHAQALAQALAQAFSQNLGTAGAQQTIVLAKTNGAFDVRFPTRSRFAQARFIWTSHAAYELLVVGTSADLTPEVADNFTRSIQFE
jgi:hypothetical protein